MKPYCLFRWTESFQFELIHLDYHSETILISIFLVRACKFIPRKSWLITGSDDMLIKVFNYNTHEKVASFEAHIDYIRSIAVHATQPLVLTSSDDMSIKLWDWEKGWKNVMVRLFYYLDLGSILVTDDDDG